MNVTSVKAHIAAIFVSFFVVSQAHAQSTQPTQAPLSYTVTDLGTLGGSTSTPFTGQQGFNQAGMIVGSSTLSDKSEHAFLFIDGQMYDLNLLCDLSTSDFKVLTVAKSIDDCLNIIGEGITTNGDKHAFLMTPTPVNGGKWCYSCCQWIWKQEGGGWQWDTGSHSYTWHGSSGGHEACPWSQPPPCFWWPLPCPDGCGCSHPTPPPDYCYGCINGHVYVRPAAEYQANGGQCYYSPEEAIKYCRPYWSCIDEKVVQTTWAECQAKGIQCYDSFGEAKKNCGPKEAQAQSTQPTQTPLSYTVSDLGTLGGSISMASVAGQQSFNTAGMIVGSSTTSDNSEHAFLHTDGQMYDLNFLCDLSTSNFKVLSSASTINDCLEIVGQGITLSGEKHAFMLTPTPVNGGRWCYSCCQWIWKQEGGGWQWDTGSHSYTWHGGAGSHSACPPNPPHCFSWPLPCPDGCGCDHACLPPEWCYCCINGVIYIRSTADCQARGGQCYACPEDAIKGCQPCHWCCVNGKVFRSNAEDCRKKGGQCFGTEEDAIRNCKACWWCCLDGKIFQTTWADCLAKGGQCYATQDEALAHQKECTPKGWCCLNGEIFPSTPEECRKRGGQFYATQQEALAHQRECKLCWCCFQGREGRVFVQTTEADCKAKGGQCFSSPEEARRRGCKPKPCWYCIDGQVVEGLAVDDPRVRGRKCYTTREEAVQNCPKTVQYWVCRDLPAGMGVVQVTSADCPPGGPQCYGSEQEAIEHCKPCWCCVPGPNGTFTYIRTTEVDCNARGGRGCYPTKEDAIAACETPPGPWCCAPTKDRAGNIIHHAFPATAQQCAAEGGQLFNTQQEALANCNLCWCCPQVKGQVVLMDAAVCKRENGQCFSTRGDAMKACVVSKSPTPTVQYWACRDLPTGMGVVQVTSADCPPGGAQCYGSEQEAIAHCNPCYCCIKNSDGTYSIVYTTEADCSTKSGGVGNCHHTKQEAEAFCSQKQTWCCVYQGAGNGGISFPADAQQCAAKGGHLYASEAEARKACRVVYCCFKDGWLESNEEACRQRGGTPYDSPQEADKACGGMLTAPTVTPPPPPPLTCWVCVDRNPVQMRTVDAQARKLQYFNSREDAQRSCAGGGTPPPPCWVCIDRNVTQMSVADAQARKLQCYNSKEDAQRGCIEGPTRWCCIDGRVVQSTEAECRARRGQLFASEQEARAHCVGGGGKLCWVCVDGKVTQLPEAEAKKRRLQCYGSEEEARAHCKPKTVWCCMDGQVAQVTEEECRARGGHAYRSEQEARRSCKGKTCWVCLNGKVVQLPEAQAQARGLQCFSSREEATRNCRPKETCWCCINGRVVQTSPEQCRSQGGQCFGSREEAARNCRREGQTPRPRFTPPGGNPYENGPGPRGTPPRTEGGPRPRPTPPG